MTVKTRITLLIAAAGFIASLLFSVVVFFELIEQPIDVLDSVLAEEADSAVGSFVKGLGKAPIQPSAVPAHAIYPYWIEIYERGSRRALCRSSLARSIELPPVNSGSNAIVSVNVPGGTIRPGQSRHRKVTFRIRTFSRSLEGRTFIVQIARPMEKLKEEIWELVLGIVAGLVTSTLVLIAVSRLIAGKILQPIGAMKDLTQDISEKNLEQRIPAGQGRDEFSELAETINRMLDRLQYSFARQRELLFDTSHELKTPLTTMRLAIDDITAGDRQSLPSFAKDAFSRLSLQVLRMERLVKDLLNLSSLEMLTRVEARPVDVAALLSALATEYRLLADARRIEIQTRFGQRLVVQADAQKLNRAFSNLLDNAIKYNVDGGRVEIAGDQTAVELTVTIGNTGPGVAASEIDRVFEQFYRVEKSRSVQYGGAGLGLAMVKRIVELHKGKVKFESQPGRWTRVTVCLPGGGEKITE